MDPATMKLIATVAAGLFGGLLGGNGQPKMTKEQKALLDAQRQGLDVSTALERIKLARRESQDPLFRALQQMSFSRLPIFARQGISPRDPSMPTGAPAGVPPMASPNTNSGPRGFSEIFDRVRGGGQ